jgi:hypothetical protein
MSYLNMRPGARRRSCGGLPKLATVPGQTPNVGLECNFGRSDVRRVAIGKYDRIAWADRQMNL